MLSGEVVGRLLVPSVVLAATGTLTARPGGIDATCAALVSGLKSGEDFCELNQPASVRSVIASLALAYEAGFCRGDVRLAHVKQPTPNRYACQHATVNIHFRLVLPRPPHLDYGLDISIFANGLPDTRSAGAQRLARPALDLTLSTISDRDVLILDLYKLQFTPPELVFWSQDQNGEPASITINLPDLLQDTVDRNTIADVASQIETTVLADARFADIRIETVFTGTELTITETVLPTNSTAPIELVINSTGSVVTLVRAG